MSNLLGTLDLTIIVLTFNEKANLPDCLESVSGLASRVVVVDSGSTDGTVELARQAGAEVVSHPFEHYAAQRNWALDNLAIETGWILNLDADERVTPELKQEIAHVLSHPETGISGYMLRQRTLFMGRWIRHGGHYPSHHLRLFRTGRGRCEDRLYDQHFLVQGSTRVLKNDYIDTVAPDVDSWTTRHLRWARLEAADIMQNAGTNGRVEASPFGDPIQRRRWLRNGPYHWAPLFLRAFAYWGYRYFLRLGFLDGREGLIFHFLQGCWFRFMVDVHLSRLKANPGHSTEPAAPLAPRTPSQVPTENKGSQ